MSNDQICVQLSKSEALVLFEWLARTDNEQSIPAKNEAEQKVLWILEGQLEKQLPVFDENYTTLLEEAYSRIAGDGN